MIWLSISILYVLCSTTIRVRLISSSLNKISDGSHAFALASLPSKPFDIHSSVALRLESHSVWNQLFKEKKAIYNLFEHFSTHLNMIFDFSCDSCLYCLDKFLFLFDQTFVYIWDSLTSKYINQYYLYIWRKLCANCLFFSLFYFRFCSSCLCILCNTNTHTKPNNRQHHSHIGRGKSFLVQIQWRWAIY